MTFKNFSGAKSTENGEIGNQDRDQDLDGEETIKLIVSVQKSTGSSSMNNNSGERT